MALVVQCLALVATMESLETLQAAAPYDPLAFEHAGGHTHEPPHTTMELLREGFTESWGVGGLLMSAKPEGQVLPQLPNDYPDRAERLSRLGVSDERHVGQLGQVEDEKQAVISHQQATILARNDHLEAPRYLNNIDIACQSLFHQVGGLGDIQKSVGSKEEVVLLTPDNHPDKPGMLCLLGNSYQILFEQRGGLEDMYKSVNYKEQAVLLAADDHPDKPVMLDNLGRSYQSLFQRFGLLDYLHQSVNYFKQAVSMTPDGHPDKPGRLSNLGMLYHLLFEQLGRLDDLHKSASCFDQAVLLTPDGHPDKPMWLNNLGNSSHCLFQRLGKLGDLHKSVSCCEQAVLLTPDGPNKPGRLNNLGSSYLSLFQRLGSPDNLHKSVSCMEEATLLTLDNHPDKPRRLGNLGSSYQCLFQRLGRLDDLHKLVGCFERALWLAPDCHPGRPALLDNLGGSYLTLFQQFKRLGDLHKSINCIEMAISLAPHGHPGNAGRLKTLGRSFRYLFEGSGTLQYASHATSCLMRSKMLAPADHPQQSIHLGQLGAIYLSMFRHSQVQNHALHSMNYFKHSAQIINGSPSIRLKASHIWALLSRWFNLSPLEAYEQCMVLLPEVVWLGTPIHDRYERLAREVGVLATEAAAAAISMKCCNLALEWLEQGRSVVWGQILQLRTPYDELHAVRPEVAEELRSVSYELDLPCGTELSNEANWKYRWASQRRGELLEYARQLPGLGDFLRPPKASTIMSWVDRTTVIVNVHEDQCDALILRAGTHTITHVPLIGFSVRKAERARSELALCLLACGIRRGFKMGDEHGNPTFTNILGMLWNDVVKPVLDHLGIVHPLPVDDLPHITWCTTGPISFLPLHAAGDYNNPSTVLSNLAVSSYTPTISSLKQRTSPPATFTGILAVGHEPAIRGLSALPGTRNELDRMKEQANDLSFTRLDEENARTTTVLHEMKDHSWVHFACHASQDKLDPTKSAFHLHDGDLDLATISHNSLKNAQLAFLSACQTATGDSALPDESIHLAAGMLMAGYPTVIATMWSICDQDAPIVAGEFYNCVLEGGVPNTGKAAMALHKAVARLRDTIGVNKFARWVPYVHIGR